MMVRVVLALWLAFCGAANAQLAGGLQFPGPGTVHTTGGCTEATNFLARTAGLSGTETTAYTTLICGLVTDGLWSKLDALYIFATKDETTAKLNLVQNSFNLTKNGTFTLTADTGWAGGGAGTDFLSTGFTPSTASGQFALNSAHLCVYVRTSRTNGSTFAEIGAQNTTTSSIAWLILTGTNTFYDLNEASTVQPSTSNAQGQWCTSRTASNLTSLYKNASSSAVATDATASVALGDNPFSIGATTNSGGGVSFNSTDQIAAASYGASFTGAQYLTFSNRVNDYMTALGVNVY